MFILPAAAFLGGAIVLLAIRTVARDAARARAASAAP
jgi:hypothetical protein